MKISLIIVAVLVN